MPIIKTKRIIRDPAEVWKDWFASDAFAVDKDLRRLFRVLPHNPRCKFCLVPFEGAGAPIVRALFGKTRSQLNPQFCNMCEEAARQFPGGNEVPMGILFADVRGSTALSESMSPLEFSRMIGRFFTIASKFITESDGLVETLSGDAVSAFWGSGFAGPDYVRRTVDTAQVLAARMAKEQIPVGIGVHAGVAFFGSVGTPGGLTNITALGDEVNTAARLASHAAAGEIIISERALHEAGIDGSALESRTLSLKGIHEPVAVRVMQAASS